MNGTDARPTAFTLGPAVLFCPADRPDRFGKALERADAVILDLEDAVAEESKDAARQALRGWFHADHGSSMPPHILERIIIRSNPVSSPHFAADLKVFGEIGARFLMLPKASGKQDIEAASRAAPGAGIIALCETAAGISRSLEIAEQPAVVALMWGSEDLIVSLGGTSSRHEDGSYRDAARYARASVLTHAAACGKSAIDAIHADIPDLSGLADAARDAAALGFAATACIHPGQCLVVREAYRPEAEEIAHAEALIAAVDGTRQATGSDGSDGPGSTAGPGGAVSFRGTMVDQPFITRARRVLQRARDAR